MSPQESPAPTGKPWRLLLWLALILLPVALAAGFIHRAGLDWAYCLAAAEGTAPRHPAPGLFSPEVRAAMIHPSWALTLVVALAFAGVSSLSILPRRARLGLLGWAGLLAALVWILHDPAALHACDRSGIDAETRLLLLLPAGWGYTFAVARAARTAAPG